ncbi:MerR family transcriptional regulator [Streptomyces sp. 891-h]|uniref:MerR family transcriptional regulator n=1 Tax=Streptomyces sp. 891-h TaxID=2720714 RepID=UPI001FAA8E62|nr:MerR family transcriptional regulator [Streptomyces sp. 891-h]
MTVTQMEKPRTPQSPTPQPLLPRQCADGGAVHPRPDGQDRYTISEVAALSGLSAHTLRWYERIGLMPHVDRSHTGQRRFTNRDLDWLELVGKLRRTGMSVADMVRYAEMVRRGAETFAERKELLEATRQDVLTRIAELHDTLAVLDYKIDIYAEKTGELPATRAVLAHTTPQTTANA